jgi:hypothetical protein
MFRIVKSMFLTVILCAFLTLAQNPDSTEVVDLPPVSSHAVGLACQALQTRFHWLISYEEPPLLAEQDLAVEKAPTGLSFHVLHEAPFPLHLSIKRDASAAEKTRVMQSIIDAYAQANDQMSFTMLGDGDVMEVVPDSVKGIDGKREPFEAMLSTKIYVAPGEYNLLTFLSEVLAAVARKRGVSINMATIPFNLFRQSIITEQADNEPARDVLTRAFVRINGPRYAQHLSPVRLTWYMAYDPDGRSYFFNVENAAPPPTPSDLRRLAPKKQ